MDDRELEARLRNHLHERFDAAPVPAGLASTVRQGMHGTAVRPVGAGVRFRGRGLQAGWLAIAAVAVLAVTLVAGYQLLPGSPGAVHQPSPSPTAAPQRTFVVVPAAGLTPSKPDSSRAGPIFETRLGALGLENFSTAMGYGFTLEAPAGGPSDADVVAVLGATGDVQFVPLPTADYGDGKLQAVVGSPLPRSEPVLFGHDQIVSVQRTFENNVPGLQLILTSEGSAALAGYTAVHLGETFAVVIDGRVALLPRVEETITTGMLSLAPDDQTDFTVPAAIIVGGRLPASWRGASVVRPIPQEQAEAAALGATYGGMVESAELGVVAASGAWRAVWNVSISQAGCSDLLSCASDSYVVEVDALTGSVLEMAVPSP